MMCGKIVLIDLEDDVCDDCIETLKEQAEELDLINEYKKPSNEGYIQRMMQ